MEIKMNGKAIGIDNGGCEGTATYPRVNAGSLDILQMAIDERESVVLTQVMLTNEQMMKLKGHPSPDRKLLKSLGPIKIGVMPDEVADGEIFRYYKDSPEHFGECCASSEVGMEAGITLGQVIACFLYTVLMNAIAQSNELSEGEISELSLYIGCPTTARWTAPKQRKIYADLVRKATGVKEVMIVPESRAALFASLQQRGFQRVSAAKGVIVFDFGSTTADCTVMCLGRGCVEFSWTLGAHEIENNMMKLALKIVREKQGEFEPTAASMLTVSDQCRRIKEMYFRGEFASKYEGIYFKDEQGDDHVEMIKIDKAFMQCALRECKVSVKMDDDQILTGTWHDLCRSFFQYAKTEVNKKALSPSSIVLTGGASRMPFVEELCKEVFGSAVTVYRENNPSYTVSNGLGTIAVVENNLEQCVEDARKEVLADWNCSMRALKEALKDHIWDAYEEKLKSVAQAWADLPGDNATLDDLYKSIDNEMAKISVVNHFNGIASGDIDAWKNTLGNKICQAANQQAGKLFSDQVAKQLMISPDVWQALQANNILFGVDAQKLLSGMDWNSKGRNVAQWGAVGTGVLGGAVGGAVGGAHVGATIGVVFGPGGAVIGGAIGGAVGGVAAGAVGLIAGALGAELLSDDDPKKSRKKKLRETYVNDRLPKELAKPETQAKLTDSIDQGFAAFENGYDELVETAVRRALDIVTLRTFTI